MAMPRRSRRLTVDLVPDIPLDRVPWMSRAACADTPEQYEDFFPETKTQERNAKQICASCPVAYECLAFAVRTTEVWGIWGGMTFPERCDFTMKYRGHTSPAAQAAHRRHITELNNRKQSSNGRPPQPTDSRVRYRSNAQSR